MNIKEIEKAVADVVKAQKSLESIYGKEFAASLLALAQNQLKQTKLYLESTKVYEGMSDEEIESQKAEERRLEQEQLQEEMKQRLEAMRPTTTAQEETPAQEEAPPVPEAPAPESGTPTGENPTPSDAPATQA